MRTGVVDVRMSIQDSELKTKQSMDVLCNRHNTAARMMLSVGVFEIGRRDTLKGNQ